MKKHLSAIEEQDVILRLDLYLKDLQDRWDREAQKKYSWIKINKNYIFECAVFIINILDELILFVEKIIPQGSDKKFAVITIVDRLFDHISLTAFPIWLKPFAPIIKKIVIDIIVSSLIDFIVSKYRNGYWSIKQEALNE
jgi:hypothetical protein